MTNVRTKPPRPLALFVSTHSEIIFCSTVMCGLLGGQEELRKRRIHINIINIPILPYHSAVPTYVNVSFSSQAPACVSPIALNEFDDVVIAISTQVHVSRSSLLSFYAFTARALTTSSYVYTPVRTDDSVFKLYNYQISEAYNHDVSEERCSRIEGRSQGR
ncbi:hypothetical protein BC629DRAFT_239707 [Irpex lacteus]|nr:hypothetical protein BC629DRAFT_239707 [Irpex lacteus]